MRRSLVCLVVGVVIVLQAGFSFAGRPQLTVLNATVDFGPPETIFIEGEFFEWKKDGDLVVFLGDEELTVNFSNETEIEAFLPSGLEPGSYLLTVSRGNGIPKYDLFEVAYGAVGPATDVNCTACVQEAELAFNPATQTELDGHAALPAAHHSRTVVNDVPVNNAFTAAISSNWASDHQGNASVHHSRYTDAEAIAAVGASTLGMLTESKTVELGPLFVGEQIVTCPAGHTPISGGFLLSSPGIPTWTSFHHVGSFQAGDSWKWKFWNESTTTTFTVELHAQCALKPVP